MRRFIKDLSLRIGHFFLEKGLLLPLFARQKSLVGTSALGYLHVTQPTASAIEKKAKKTKEAKEQDIEKSTPETKKPRVKSPEAKQAVVDADMETMSAYGLVQMVRPSVVSWNATSLIKKLQQATNTSTLHQLLL